VKKTVIVVVVLTAVCMSMTVEACSALAPVPTVTVRPSPLPAITITPTPTRGVDTPLDSLEAWTICVAWRNHFEATTAPSTNTQTYSPNLVTQSGSKFTVAYKGKFNELEPSEYCVISGTLGNPVIDNE
jgi:hypothetical protein